VETFVWGFMVTVGVAGGTLVNALFLTRYIVKVDANNGNGNGKVAGAKAQLLMEQQVEALQAVCGTVEKTRERATEDTKEVCDLLAAQSTAIALLHQAQQTHAEQNQMAWRDTFALLRDK